MPKHKENLPINSTTFSARPQGALELGSFLKKSSDMWRTLSEPCLKIKYQFEENAAEYVRADAYILQGAINQIIGLYNKHLKGSGQLEITTKSRQEKSVMVDLFFSVLNGTVNLPANIVDQIEHLDRQISTMGCSIIYNRSLKDGFSVHILLPSF